MDTTTPATVDVSILVRLTEETQRREILAGRDGRAVQIRTLALETTDPLCSVPTITAAGVLCARAIVSVGQWSYREAGRTDLPSWTRSIAQWDTSRQPHSVLLAESDDVSEAGLRAILQSHADAAVASIAEIDAEIHRYLTGEAVTIPTRTGRGQAYADRVTARGLDAAVSAEATRRDIAHRAASAERQATQAAQDAESRRRREEREAAEAARSEAKSAYLAAWITTAGGERATRQADGLLCRDEAREALAASVLDAVASASDLETCGESDCPCHTTDVTCLPAAAYEGLVALRARLPEGATLDDYSFVLGCGRPATEDADEDTDTTDWPQGYETRLTVQAGPWQFTRRVRLS